MPSSWQIWLSTNSDSDATAIWMERKFDVPDSGYWVSESVFSIPVTQSRDRSKGFPGVIVFECTPIQNVKDDIERSDPRFYCDVSQKLIVFNWSENTISLMIMPDFATLSRRYPVEDTIYPHCYLFVGVTLKTLLATPTSRKWLGFI